MDPIMLTQLTTDLSRILKVNTARFDNDASSCYDRIIVALGMLAARRCGMPENAISLHASALKFMKYTVKTVYGISEDTYQGTDFEPLFGTGQGSGASPAVWLSMVVLLLHTLDHLIPHRTKFSSPEGALTHSRLTDAFVDDTTLGINDWDTPMQYEEMIQHLQTAAQTWEHLLSLSGGTLNLKKCNWYMIYWEWHNGRPRMRLHHQGDPHITIVPYATHDRHTIHRKSLDTATKILGVYLTPTGNFSEQIRVCKQKADTYAARLYSPRLTASDIQIFHKTIYAPTMRYCLPALSVPEEELATVQSKIIPAMLRKMHVAGNLPTSIRHGPLALGGLGIFDMRTEMGIENLKFLRNAIFSKSSAGDLILMNLQYLQLEAGIGECLLEYPTIPLPYLTSTWLTSVRNYMANHNISVTITEQPSLQLSGRRDQFIMQPHHLARYSTAQQRDINLVRLYLQVNTLAEMQDVTRPNTIALAFLDGRRDDSRISNLRWPHQMAPTSSQRRLWKRYISSSFLRYIPYWKEIPLGSDEVRQPTYLERPRSIRHSNDVSYTNASLSENINKLPRTQRRLLDDIKQIATDLQVWRAFRSKERLYIASDGGLFGQHGTFGWILSTKKQVLFQCGGPVDGPSDTTNSTRCELCGFASSLLLIATLSRTWGLRHTCTFRWFTDSKSAISKIKRITRHGAIAGRQPYEADLLTSIQSLLKEIRRKITFRWIKGHQDNLQSYSKLPRSVQMNIDADFLATRYRKRGKLRPSQKIDHQPEQRISFSINGVRVTSQYDDCIRYHVNGYHLRRYMQEKKQWSDITWNDIDFELFGTHFRRLTAAQQIHQMKAVHDQLPLGTTRYKRSSVPSPSLKLCPCCKSTDEDSTHFFRCAHNPIQQPGLVSLLKEKSYPQAHPLRKLLVGGLRHWIATGHSDFCPDLTAYPPHMKETVDLALKQQNTIGWDNAFRGFLSKKWYELSTQSYTDTTIDHTIGTSRMKHTIQAIHGYTTALWKARNEILHDNSNDDMRTIRSDTIASITDYHRHPDKMLFEDRHLCSMPLETLLKASVSTQRRWLHRVKVSREQYTHQGTRQTLMTAFFRRTDNT
ncbi:hypothetical protein MHU86_25142 [Fragilaria crotonensis]|nr:hypothetical protein MHU86_25142 [Fragilaria crotonensis]